FFSGQDVNRWDYVMTKSAEEMNSPQETVAAQRALLEDMARLASNGVCRHAALSRYFGQAYEKDNCGACDVCLGELEAISDSGEVAEKVIAAVDDLGQRFGVGHVLDVLLGAHTERIGALGHDRLVSFGSLKDRDRKLLQSLVYQL